MSFNYINKITLLTLSVIIFSCQDSSKIFKEEELTNKVFKVEENEKIDFSYYEKTQDDVIDFYSKEKINYNFLNSDIKSIKISSYESKLKSNIPINVFINESYIYTLNYKGDILKFDANSGRFIEKYIIDILPLESRPNSLTLIDNDFIISFKSGEIIRTNKKGEIKWLYKKENFLNTPIKYHDGNLIVLYPEDFVIISPVNGKVIFEKNYKVNNIFQSSGGKIQSYFNIIYFILPNSQFQSIDTYLFEEHSTNLDSIEINTSLNNLYDNIHIYNNLFVYLDNQNTMHTYDIINNEFLLEKFKIEKINSYNLFNNSIIIKNNNFINIHNIKNGNIFVSIEIDNIVKKKC